MNSAKKSSAAEDPRFVDIAAAFSKDRAVERGKMFGSSGLKVNGKVFAMLVKGDLVVKLPKERVDALVAAGSGRHFDPGHGRPMKEWLTVSDANLPWVELSKEAYAFVKGVES